MMTAHASTETAVESMRLGAADYFIKPFSMDELKLKVRRHFESHRLRVENQLLKRALETSHDFSNIIGRSPRMVEIFKMVETIAKTTSTVLITGQSGTGKDMIARAIHTHSLRKDEPFVALNCGAVQEALLESELFGHMRGACTGAERNRKGLVEVADRGTIFLDEIGFGQGGAVASDDCNATPTQTNYYASSVPQSLGSSSSGSRACATSQNGAIWALPGEVAPTEPFGPLATSAR
jgi:DNA-binding NtrC family response regulator